MKNYLPIGTIVTINGIDEKLMICGRNYNDSDYIAYLYPEGFEGNKKYEFNSTEIINVIYRGYSDLEEEKYIFKISPQKTSAGKIDFSNRNKRIAEEVKRDEVEKILEEALAPEDEVADTKIDAINIPVKEEYLNEVKLPVEKPIKEQKVIQPQIPKIKVENPSRANEGIAEKEDKKIDIKPKKKGNSSLNSLAGLMGGQKSKGNQGNGLNNVPKSNEDTQPKEKIPKLQLGKEVEVSAPKIDKKLSEIDKVEIKKKEVLQQQQVKEINEQVTNNNSNYEDVEDMDDDSGTTLLGLDLNDYKTATLTQVVNGRTIDITNDEIKIGRSGAYSNYVVDNIAVGRLHATIVANNDRYYLVDNQSKNGTFINGLKIQPNEYVEIKNRDSIKLANEEFIFEVE